MRRQTYYSTLVYALGFNLLVRLLFILANVFDYKMLELCLSKAHIYSHNHTCGCLVVFVLVRVSC